MHLMERRSCQHHAEDPHGFCGCFGCIWVKGTQPWDFWEVWGSRVPQVAHGASTLTVHSWKLLTGSSERGLCFFQPCFGDKSSNLEAYVKWFNRLCYLVATEICMVSGKSG